MVKKIEKYEELKNLILAAKVARDSYIEILTDVDEKKGFKSGTDLIINILKRYIEE